MSNILEALGKTALRDDVTIVPAGGLDKVVTFIALLGANGLKLAVFHDHHGKPEQSLMELVKQKMISSKAVLNASQFRDITNIGVTGQSSDTEDLFDVDLYLHYFNRAFKKQLQGKAFSATDLPQGDRFLNGSKDSFLKKA